jgi:hypothetical protein
MQSNNYSLFDKKGRRIPFNGMRVFNESSLSYYKIKTFEPDFNNILSNSKMYSNVDSNITVEKFELFCMELKEKIQLDAKLKDIFNGVAVPFICPKLLTNEDIGTELEKTTLPCVASSFKASYPNLHFKATIQGSAKLALELSIDSDSRYENFIASHKRSIVAGWYFPMALQEYDIASQRNQMKTLPDHDGLVLSGGLDIAAALVGSPNLLVNEDDYTPVLCMSSYKHTDNNLMLCFKSYGQHLEFWCMSQMLTPNITQVSEQWSGGLTLFGIIE